ncbi:MAG: tetratricopeptide repeat protein [Cellulophaga sp.]
MTNKWKSLTQDNKVKLIVFIFGAVLIPVVGVAGDRNNLGSAWNSLSEYQKAIAYYEQALSSDLKTYGEAHPAVATIRNNLGLAWSSLGKYQKAIAHYELALVTMEKKLKNHPNTAVLRNNLASAREERAKVATN